MTNDQLAALNVALDLALKHKESDCLDCVFETAGEIFLFIRSWDGVEEEVDGV